MDNEVISFLMVIVEVQSGIYLSFYFGCILVVFWLFVLNPFGVLLEVGFWLRTALRLCGVINVEPLRGFVTSGFFGRWGFCLLHWVCAGLSMLNRFGVLFGLKVF